MELSISGLKICIAVKWERRRNKVIWNKKKLELDITSDDLMMIQSFGPEADLLSVLRDRNSVLPPIPSVKWLVLFVIKTATSAEHFWTNYRQITQAVDNTSKWYDVRNIDGRMIYRPWYPLSLYQEWVQANILEMQPVSEYATAYAKGSGTKKNAEPHVGRACVVKLDIRHFFDSITFRQIYRAFETITDYPKPVLTFLARLCSVNGHLPQGASTSPMLSNLCMLDIDKEIGAYCVEKGISYTRYSDDMTFSADSMDVQHLLLFVESLLSKNGFRVNKRKTRVLKKGVCHNVTGVVCNEKVHVPAEYKKKIRQEMYYIEKYGFQEHLDRMDKEKYADIHEAISYFQVLTGKIKYVLGIEKDNDAMRAYYKKAVIILKNLLRKAKRSYVVILE